jgi:hypothetical protein
VTEIAWGVEDTCDLKVWKNVSGCNGIDKPWAFSTLTESAAGVVGKVRAWHYLANKAEDKTKIWSIEKGDTLNALLYVFTDYKDNGSGTWANTSSKTWTVKSILVKAASSTMIGTAAIISGLIITLF